MKKALLILLLLPVFGWSQKETKAEAPTPKSNHF